MVNFSLNLNNDYARPTSMLYGLLTLIDTGAVIPVFSIAQSMIESRFRGHIVYADKYFGGFGGGEVHGDIYSFANFYVKQLHFKTLEAFVPREENIAYPLLFSSTMFRQCRYEIDPLEGKMNFSVPEGNLKDNEFIIKNLSDKICVQLNGILYQQ